ncbi:hypothetical protein HPG69_005173 [Diceros bicornis minor]|uniref:Uncharacterized protein n=1 Tax=Diceros bicornis minor TaxID=77932 RepID=A0A7J7EGW7_DICBM|nr:hypothetical protein HPG69_005173 [Diceros bicornis minor]
MGAGQCQGLEVTRIFLSLPSDSQLLVLPKKNLTIWRGQGGGFLLSYPCIWHGGQERTMTSSVRRCRLRSP